MYGIDTNVLLRYLVKDDPKQAQTAAKFIKKNCTQDTPGFINCIVLCELVWVLESAYKYNRQIITAVLGKILFTRQFKIENLPCVQQAVQAYGDEKVDFADYLIASINRANDCEYTVSFDKKAINKNTFMSLLN